MEARIQEKALEVRAARTFEIRAAEDGKKYVEGYAIRWNDLSSPIGWYYKFREQFRAGAFDDYLASGEDTKFLLDHDIGKILGRSKKNTLALKSDAEGLFYSLEMPATTLGGDAYEDVRAGNKEHISVGFKMLAEEWDESDESNITRAIVKANLIEISLTGWPYYESTTASTRSVEDPYKAFKDSQAGQKPVEIDGNRHYITAVEKKINILSRG